MFIICLFQRSTGAEGINNHQFQDIFSSNPDFCKRINFGKIKGVLEKLILSKTLTSLSKIIGHYCVHIYSTRKTLYKEEEEEQFTLEIFFQSKPNPRDRSF